MSESYPTLLGSIFTVSGGMEGLKQTFQPEHAVTTGSGYTVQDLL